MNLKMLLKMIQKFGVMIRIYLVMKVRNGNLLYNHGVIMIMNS